MAFFKKREQEYLLGLNFIVHGTWPRFSDYCPKPEPLKLRLHPTKYEKMLLSDYWNTYIRAVDKCYAEKKRQIEARYAELDRDYNSRRDLLSPARREADKAIQCCFETGAGYRNEKNRVKFTAPLVKEYTQAVRKLCMSKSLDLIESSLIVNIAERLLPAIHQEAMAASRESHVEIIRAVMELEVRKDQLILRSTDKEKENFKSLVVFDFERERCPMPATVMDYSAIGRAVGHCVAVLYMEQHPKDPCGMPCVIHMKNEIYGCYRDTKTGEEIEYVIYPLQYAAKNKGFQQVKQW